MTGYKFEDFLVSNEKAIELLNHPTDKYVLIGDYGEDKKLLMYVPYIPLQITNQPKN